MNGNNRYVVKHPQGWAVKKADATRASGVFSRQSDAERSARRIVSSRGGGEVRIQGRNGRWRDSDTIRPGRDPFPPRDQKH